MDEASFDLAVTMEIPGDAAELCGESKEREKRARDEASAAARRARRTIVGLQQEKLSQSEAALVLDITSQGVHQLDSARVAVGSDADARR